VQVAKKANCTAHDIQHSCRTEPQPCNVTADAVAAFLWWC